MAKKDSGKKDRKVDLLPREELEAGAPQAIDIEGLFSVRSSGPEVVVDVLDQLRQNVSIKCTPQNI